MKTQKHSTFYLMLLLTISIIIFLSDCVQMCEPFVVQKTCRWTVLIHRLSFSVIIPTGVDNGKQYHLQQLHTSPCYSQRGSWDEPWGSAQASAPRTRGGVWWTRWKQIISFIKSAVYEICSLMSNFNSKDYQQCMYQSTLTVVIFYFCYYLLFAGA